MAKTIQEMIDDITLNLANKPIATSPTPPSMQNDGFTENVLMKGVPGMENKSPSFNGLNDVAWTPSGPLKRDDLPPSPLNPDTQSVMMAASGLPAAPKQQEAVQEVKSAQVPQKTALAKPEAPTEQSAAPEEEPIEKSTIKEPSALDKLLEAYNSPQKDDELSAEQKRRNEIMNQLGMLKGVNRMSEAIAQVKPNEEYLNEEMARAGQGVKDIEQRRDQERKMKTEKGDAIKLGMDVERFKTDSEAKGIDLQKAKLQLKDAEANKDPNSDISKATREAVQKRFALAGAKVNVPPNLSADQIKSIYPMGDIVDDLLKQQTAKESAAARKENKADRDEMMKEQKRQALTTHISDKIKQVDDKVGYNKALTDYEMLSDRLNTGKFDSISDVAATYALMKALDPGSVVRESEFDTLKNAAGGFNRFKQAPERFFKGDIYSPNFRKKLLDQFNGVVDSRRRQLYKVLEPDLKRAKELGIDESHIISPSTTKSFEAQAAPASVADSAAAELARRKQGK